MALASNFVLWGFAIGIYKSNDYYWHLKAGEIIVELGKLPTGDPFSYTFLGERWVLHEWLFELLLYALDAAAGPGGTIIAVILIASAAVYIPYSIANERIAQPAVSFLLAALFSVILFSLAAARPQIFSYLFFAITLGVIIRAVNTNKILPLALLPPLMVIWVNMHGAYILGLALIAGHAVLEWGGWLIARECKASRKRAAIWLSLTFFACVAASAVNPWGVYHWLYPLEVMQLKLVPFINEWKPVMLFRQGVFFLLSGVLFLIFQVTRNGKPGLSELLIPLGLFGAGMMQARQAPFAAIAMLAYVGPAVGDGAIRNMVAAVSPRLLKWTETLNVQVSKLSAGVIGWGFTLLLAIAVPQLIRVAYIPSTKLRVPAGAADFIEDAGLKGRMLNGYGTGGYLTWRFYPERLVFIDSRADVYGDDFFFEVKHTFEGNLPLSTHFDGWNIDFAILQESDALRQLLLQRGDFIEAYSDRMWSVLVRKESENDVAAKAWQARNAL